MGRIFPFLANILVTVAVVLGTAAGSVGRAQDGGVFRYQDRQGRLVYTNLEGMASHGRALTRVTLPPLASVEQAKPEELRALDAQVRESHSALQAGELCEAIRSSSRIPLRSRLWSEHGHRLSVAAALLVFAALLGFMGAGRKLGQLLPVAPIIGCGFLIYATIREVQSAREALTAGLRACSEQLPDGDPESKVAVEGRLSKALDLQNTINVVYERQSAQIESIMRER